MKQVLSIITTLLFITSCKAQSYCQWYNWTASDFPANTSNQNFAEICGAAYLNASDFTSTGSFYGESWTKVFFTNPYYYRPLGFKYAVLGAYNDPTVCIQVDDVASYHVELMVYTFSSSKICVADMSQDAYNSQSSGAVSNCATQYLYACFNANADYKNSTLKVALYCSTGCETDLSVQLLYRFRRSTYKWSDSVAKSSSNPDMWCTMIASVIVWPDEISDAVPGTYAGSNSNLNGSNMLSTLVVLYVCLFSLFFISY